MTENFFRLDPGSIIDVVEAVVDKGEPGLRATGRALALNSLENRVYDIELEEGENVVAKFYRPGRWTREQIREEHAFLFALEDAEIPVVAPWQVEGESLFPTKDGLWFALFPKIRGRLRDELDKDRLKTLGRYIGRIHNVGEHFPFRHRLRLSAEEWGTKPMEYVLQSGMLDPLYHARYRMVCESVVKAAATALRDQPTIALHGDCHLGNTLWQLDSPFFLDFDDSMTAPAVQDIWMVVRGRGPEADADRNLLLEGYEAFRPFDRSSLGSIELLRALRMIHYSAWIAKRWEDPSFPKAFPLFATPRYWEEEIQALQEILALMEEG